MMVFCLIRSFGKILAVCLFLIVLGVAAFYAYVVFAAKQTQVALVSSEEITESSPVAVEPFPVGVNVAKKEIAENPAFDTYVSTHLSYLETKTRLSFFVDRIIGEITRHTWYQQLAAAVSRIVVIYAGERHEEVVDAFGDVLRWNADERATFSRLLRSGTPALFDGTAYPGRYVFEVGASPEVVAQTIEERFAREIYNRYDATVAAQVPLTDALIIASLLEREAYDFTDMRIISGIIWNRLFINMPLQLDATLQYAKATENTGTAWWSKVVPADKFIASPFNTYENTGLPPSPIANPSVESVIATLNPKQTDCFFYFHDTDGTFYCTATYEEHVAKLTEIYGQGR